MSYGGHCRDKRKRWQEEHGKGEWRSTVAVPSYEQLLKCANREGRKGQDNENMYDTVGATFDMGKGCMWSAELHASTLRVCGETLQCDIALSAQYMASDASILAGADALSRTEDDYTDMLKTAVVRKLWGCQGPYSVNCCSPDAVPRVMSGRECQYVSPLMWEAVHRNELMFCHP